MSEVKVAIVMADQAREGGRYSRAAALYTMAASEAASAAAHDPAAQRQHAHCLQMNGVCMARLGENEVAARLYEAAIEEYQQLGDELGVARVLRDRADSLRARGNLDAAVADLERSTALFKQAGERDELVANEHFRGRVERQRGDALAEGQHLVRAYVAVSSGEAPGSTLYVCLDWTSFLIRQHRTGEARKLAIWCLRESLRRRSWPHIDRSARLLLFAGRPQARVVRRALYGRS